MILVTYADGCRAAYVCVRSRFRGSIDGSSFLLSLLLFILLPFLCVFSYDCVCGECMCVCLYMCALRELLRARANVPQHIGERSIFPSSI